MGNNEEVLSLGQLHVYLSSRRTFQVRKLLNYISSCFLLPVRLKLKSHDRLPSAVTVLVSSELNGGKDGPLPCWFSEAQLPVTGRREKWKPVMNQHHSAVFLTARSPHPQNSPCLSINSKVSPRQLLARPSSTPFL